MSQNNTFEQKMQRLEQIVRAMERGDAPLEETMKLFREGTQLVSACEKLLDAAELEVKKIVPQTNGEPAEEVFVSED